MNSKVASLLARLSFAAAASLTIAAPALIAGEAQAVVISAADRCHADLATSTRRYLERVLRARVRCLDGKIDGLYPPTTDCVTDDEETKLNKRLRKAQDKLSNMGSDCGGVNLALLGYPGICADPTPATAFDTQDLKTCVVIKTDDIVENLLDYYFPPINDFFRGSDARCMKGTGTDGSISFSRMLRAREHCLLGQDVGLVDDEVNCRGEILPYGPGTGSDSVDLEVSRAYIRLLGAIPASCVDVQINDLNYQSSCPDPTGGIFTIFDLKDCLFDVNRAAVLQTLAINFATEAICGDGTVQAGEQCDQGVGANGNSNTRPNACRTDCTNPKCGDSVTDTAAPNNETCDDGNTVDTDCCSNACVASGCGDGVENAACGEECDTGDARSNTLPDRCRLDCTDFRCGDNVQDTGEECDDPAPAENNDGCSALCFIEFCGDDIIQTGLGEQCDNGVDNAAVADKCRPEDHPFACKNPTCGDGIEDTGEQCDDGNTSNTDACGFPVCNDIVPIECGNGLVEAGEECDSDNNDCPAGEGCVAEGQPNQCQCLAACPGVGELVLHSGVGPDCSVNADCDVGTCDIAKGKCITVTRLDSGWNGAAHNADINEGVRTRGYLVCPGHGPTCGQCTVNGVDPSTRTCRCEKDIRQICDDKFELTSQCLTCDGGNTLNNTACDANSDCLSAGTCTRNVRVCANDPNKICTQNSQCPGSTCNAAATKTTCTNATTTFCTSAAQCSFQGTCNKPSTCNCYLGSPFPLSSQGTPACILNRFSVDVSGTANVDEGAGSITAKLRTVVYLGPDTKKPCASCGGKCTNNPSLLCDRDLDCEGGTCDLDDFIDDGDRGGVCIGGAHEGLSCDVQSINTSFPAFTEGPNGGGYSLDCLPITDSNISGTGLIINLTQTTGTSELLAQQSCLGTRPDLNCPCLMCTGIPSVVPCNTNLDCLEAAGTCSGSSAIQCTVNGDCAAANGGNCTANGNTRCSLALQVECHGNNSECASVNVGNCVAATCTSDGGGGFPEPNKCDNGLCSTLPDGTGECTQGPDNSYCSGVLRANGEGILGCSLEEDCAPEAVGIDARPCATVSRRKCFPDPIVATGDPDPGSPIGAATFCIPPTINPGVNLAAGLPGPGRVINQATSKTFCGTSTQQYVPGVGGCVPGQVP